MTHPLANDPTVPASLQRLFARVTHKVVCTFDDGSTSSVNCLSADNAEREANDKRALIGTGRFRPMPGGNGADRRLVSVEIQDI